MQQRYCDPAIGRFLSVDPVTADGNTGGNFNRYWYANNNPYKFTDPDGRAPFVLPAGIPATNLPRSPSEAESWGRPQLELVNPAKVGADMDKLTAGAAKAELFLIGSGQPVGALVAGIYGQITNGIAMMYDGPNFERLANAASFAAFGGVKSVVKGSGGAFEDLGLRQLNDAEVAHLATGVLTEVVPQSKSGGKDGRNIEGVRVDRVDGAVDQMRLKREYSKK